jgi:phospholipase C
VHITAEKQNMVNDNQFFTDAAAGTLPDVSFFMPGPNPEDLNYSQHNLDSITAGENKTAQVFNALANSPEANTTAFVKIWDDCGCFYDHASSPQPIINGYPAGPRIPALFAGAYVKPGSTDSTPADFTSIDALVEWLFGAPAMTARDRVAYNFSHVFDFTKPPKRAEPIPQRPISAEERAQLQAQPDNSNDPS